MTKLIEIWVWTQHHHATNKVEEAKKLSGLLDFGISLIRKKQIEVLKGLV
ncbi:MAG: hypothetical protein IPK55_12390 [Streptococcus sp.]|nr:hypothetical protein [Streptococcus sp.]